MTHDYFKQGPSLPVTIHWFSSVWASQITNDEASSFLQLGSLQVDLDDQMATWFYATFSSGDDQRDLQGLCYDYVWFPFSCMVSWVC